MLGNQHQAILSHQTHMQLPDTNLGKAVKEISANIQVDQGMVLLSYLGAISTVSQGCYQVELPTGQIKPLSQAILITANSGERKSAVMDEVMKSLRGIEKTRQQGYKQDLLEWGVNNELWKGDHKAIMRSIRKAEKEGVNTAECRSQLFNHVQLQPKKPIKAKVLFENATSSAIFKSLSEGLPFGSLISSEGQLILDSKLFRDFGVFNKLWDQEPVMVNRANMPDIEIDGATLSSFIMVQPGVLRHLLDKNGALIRDSGLWSRYLVYKPPQLQGSRFLFPDTPKSWEYSEEILTRISELYSESLDLSETQVPKKKILKFSVEATQLFADFHNKIESQCSPGGYFDGLNDLASKLSQNVGRTAANVHLLDGKSGSITSDSLILAIKVCMTCAEHFRTIFTPPPQEWLDAILLEDWIERKRSCGFTWMDKNEARRCCPNSLRGQRFYRALDILVEYSRAGTYLSAGKKLIDLRPAINSAPLGIMQPEAMFISI